MAQIDLSEGPITKNMLLFAFPMICGNMLQQLYNVVDTLIVGRVPWKRGSGGGGILLFPDDIFDLHPAGALHGERRLLFHQFWETGI